MLPAMTKAHHVLVVLGNTNDQHGNLSETALLRAKAAVKFWKKHSHYLILPTGAFGDFNSSSVPHGQLLASHMTQNGVNADSILDYTRTSNTYEDALEVLRQLSRLALVEHVHIITSSFHMPRAKFIFSRALREYKLSYEEADNPGNTNQLASLKKHEKRKLDSLKKHEKRETSKVRTNWVNLSHFDLMSHFDLEDFPEASYNSLGNELRHYDNLSYFAIVAGIFVTNLFATGNWSYEFKLSIGIHTVGAILIIAFWYLYIRLASTAASARHTLSAMEEFYRKPGISSTHNNTALFGCNVKIQQTISLVFSIMLIVVLAHLFLFSWS